MSIQSQSVQDLHPDNTPPSTIGDDLLCGADNIAKFLFGDSKHRRKIYYLTGNTVKYGIPSFKIGSVTCARKSSLLDWIEQLEVRQAKHHV